MPRKGRNHTRLTHAATVTAAQVKIILRQHWAICLVGAAVFGIFTAVLALSEPVSFRASALLKVKTFDIRRLVSDDPLKRTDMVAGKEFLDYQVRLASTPEFSVELAKLVETSPHSSQIRLTWGIGDQMRLNWLFARLAGRSTGAPTSADLTKLSKEELSSIFLRAARITPIYNEGTITIDAAAFDEQTARLVAELISEAYVNTSRTLEQREISSSLTFLRKEQSAFKQRLQDADDSLKAFYRANPFFTGESAGKGVTNEANALRQESVRRSEEIVSNRRLLEFYKQRFNNFTANSDTTTEVYDKFKQELVELKFRKKKFLFEGYRPEHEGMRELDGKIATIERILSEGGSSADRRVVSVGHETKLSVKIVELQDQIKKQEIELESLNRRLETAEARSRSIPEKTMQHDELQREIRIAKEIFENVSRRIELGSVRERSPEGSLDIVPMPIYARIEQPPSAVKRTIFGALMGFVFAAASIVLLSVVRKKVIDGASVDQMGFKFAGELRPSNSHRAKVLLQLGCQYHSDDTSREPVAVLCSSPQGSSHLEHVHFLTEYLEMQREKSLLIIVGAADVQRHFQLRQDLGYAKVFNSRSGGQFILQITDDETVYCIRDCLRITERQYQVKYTMVFIYVADGLECLAYAYTQQIADKMLLIGPSGKHTDLEYLRLTEGFRNLDEVYVSLTGIERKQRNIPPRRAAPPREARA